MLSGRCWDGEGFSLGQRLANTGLAMGSRLIQAGPCSARAWSALEARLASAGFVQGRRRILSGKALDVCEVRAETMPACVPGSCPKPAECAAANRLMRAIELLDGVVMM